MRMWRRARCCRAGETPCPSWPMIQPRPGQGCAMEEVALGASWLPATGPPAGRCLRAPPPRPAAGRNGRPCPRAQHLATPERSCAFQRRRLREPECRCAAQDGAHVTCILQAVENATVGILPSNPSASGSGNTNPMGAGDSRALMSLQSASAITTFVAARAYSAGAWGQNDSENTATAGFCPRASAALQMISLQPHTALLAVCGTVLRQAAQLLEQCVVARLDESRRGVHRKRKGG